MKNLFSALMLSIVFSTIFKASPQSLKSWTEINSPVSTFLRNLSFIDSLTGWAAGASGIIINTTDGGNNWNIQNSGVSSFITDIFFIDKQSGWAITIKDEFPFNTIILKTTNGGGNWMTYDFPDSNAFMTTVFFHDSLNGFIGGSYIAKTSDGGNNWLKAGIDSSMLSSLPIYKFRFSNENFGYAVGGAQDLAGVIWKTTNGGFSWSATGISPDEIFDLFIIDSLNAISLSGDPEEFYSTGNIKTTNAGESWTYEELPFYSLSFAIDFRTESEAWSASGYKFLMTSDAGKTWNEQGTPGGTIIYDLEFTDSRTGFAVGEGGTILKFIPPPVYIEENEKDLPGRFELYQNHPNPFNSSTVISWNLNARSIVSLAVYDILGREIDKLFNAELEPGFHTYRFSGDGLSSGIYFYRIKAVEVCSKKQNSFTSTKIMNLLK